MDRTKVIAEIRKCSKISLIGWVIQLRSLNKIKNSLPKKISREIQLFHQYDLRTLRALEKRLNK